MLPSFQRSEPATCALTLFISDFCIMQIAEQGGSALPFKLCSIDILSLKVWSAVWKLASCTKQGRRTGSDKHITHLLPSNLQHLWKIGWMKEPQQISLSSSALAELWGPTSHMDELFLNNLSDVVDTNRLCSNTKKACLTCLFLLNNIPVDNPATFLEESFPLIVVQGSAKSWGKTSRCGVSRPDSLRCNSIEMWVHFYEVPKSWERLICL